MDSNLFDFDNSSQEFTSDIHSAPFDRLDAYNTEALQWAHKVEILIDLKELSEKNMLIISVALAYIFSVFIYSSMNYPLYEYEDYFDDTVERPPDDAWLRMHRAKREIYSSLLKVLHDPYEIYLTLHDSILIAVESNIEGEDDYLTEPYDYNDLGGFGFVSNCFEY